MDSLLLFSIPLFQPVYPETEKIPFGYTTEKEKLNLKTILSKSSLGYCMYCYKRIDVDGKNDGHLEHGIERQNSDKLSNCVPNIGISCATCNLSFKRRGEKKRKLSASSIQRFENNAICPTCCATPCPALRKLQEEYSQRPGSEILIQPLGVYGPDSGAPLRLQYDVLKAQFVPSTNYPYSDAEKSFIEKHILRFNLNDTKYKTKELIEFITEIVNNEGKIPRHTGNNLIVVLFSRYLNGKKSDEILKICSMIYSISAIHFNL